MVKNIGIDIIEIDRFNDFLENEDKLKKILSPQEIESLQEFNNKSRKLEYIAGRFASKEALHKAGVNFNFNEVSILNDDNGRPYVICNKCKEVLISISHNKSMAIAFVVVIDPCFTIE